METVLSILAGAVITWIAAYYYYRKQTKEQINPIPQIKGVHEAVLELYGIAIDSKNERLQEVVKKLVLAMVVTRHRVLNNLAVPILLLAMIKDIPRLREISDFDITPRIDGAQKAIKKAADEFEGLSDTVEQIVGKRPTEIVTFDELLEDLFKEKKMLNL